MMNYPYNGNGNVRKNFSDVIVFAVVWNGNDLACAVDL